MIALRRLTVAFTSLTVLVAGFFAPACASDTPGDDASPVAGTSGAAGKGGTAGTTGGSAGSAGTKPSGGSAGDVAANGGTGNAGSAGSTSAGTSGNASGGQAGNTAQGGTAGATPNGGAGSAQGGVAGASGTPGGASGTAGTTAGSGGTAGSNGGSAGGGGSGGSGGTGGNAHVGPWRIMPIGDSITATTCYPQLLSQKLKDAGHTNFSFLGTNLNNQSCSGAPNVMTEGHGGYILSCLTGDWTNNCAGKGMPSELMTWLNATPPPDVALILFGTNDVWNSIATDTITTAFTHLTTSIRDANPNAVIFIGQILPMHPEGCADSNTSCVNNRVKTLNAAIPAWATSQSTAASPIHVVDIYGSIGSSDAFTTNSALSSDGVHPNATGAGMMADAWMEALLAQGIPE